MTVAGIALVGLLAAGGATPMGRPAGTPLAGSQLDARTEEVAGLLRCPVCQGLSVADSPATMARNMKLEVREKLAAGYDQEQILVEFERSYGEFVRLRPPLRGANWVVWLGPAAFLLAGGAVVAFALRKPRGAAGSKTLPAPVEAADRGMLAAPAEAAARGMLPDDPRLAEAVRRVRALAYGWPDGVPPKTGSAP